MARLLSIDNCDECKHRARFRHYCYLAGREFDEQTQPATPDWCPLPVYQLGTTALPPAMLTILRNALTERQPEMFLEEAEDG